VRVRLPLLALALGTAGLLAAATPTSATPTDPPDEVQVPPGNTLAMSTLGEGVQIYDCVDGAWKFREPAAKIKADDHDVVALHFAGPTWQSVDDGSKVVAEVEAKVDAADPAADVPLLLLRATETAVPGELDGVTWIQRLDTMGGVAPEGSCDPEAEPSVGVPYTATYNFWVAEM
jgi:hypothetical protein